MVLLSLSIAVLGYFALQYLPERGHAPRLAANSSNASETTAPPTPSAVPGIARGRH